MRRIGQAGVILLLLTAAIVVPTTAAQACRCAMGTPAGAVSSVLDVVFLGEVVERKGKRVERVNDNNLPVGGQFTYTFSVERVYKGEVDVDQRVVAGVEGAACGIVLNPGQTYLVYGDGREHARRQGRSRRVLDAPLLRDGQGDHGAGRLRGRRSHPSVPRRMPPLAPPAEPDLDLSDRRCRQAPSRPARRSWGWL